MPIWKAALCAGAAAAAMSTAAMSTAARAEDPAAAQPTTPALTAPAPAAPVFPLGMNGPIVINPTPYGVDAGPLGSITVNGAASGLAFAQSSPVAGDHRAWGDVSNAQLLIEKTDGLVQFFVDAGAYAFPTVGTPYTRASKTLDNTFGAVAMAFLKLAPTSNFSVEVGKLPTLIGAEYNFTFENANIERGLLWNQENLVNRGVQVNYTAGPVAFSLSVNDGYYSNSLSWVTGSATWSIDGADTLAFSAGGNTRTTLASTSATPLLQNNSQIYNLIYTHTAGPWTLQPYLQYTRVPSLAGAGQTARGTSSASTFGGAILVTYAFPAAARLGGLSLSGFSLPARVEYIASTGSANLLYGPGSKAWSLTVTPTYQWKIYYVRAELSYVGVDHILAGAGFGASGDGRSQARGLLEAGVLF